MEILKKEQYPEYEAFCKSHPQGGFTQSTFGMELKTTGVTKLLFPETKPAK